MVFDLDDLVSIGDVYKLQCKDGIFVTLVTFTKGPKCNSGVAEI